MKIRHIVTHQVIEGTFTAAMGWWQHYGPGLLMISYPMSEWEEVKEGDETPQQ